MTRSLVMITMMADNSSVDKVCDKGSRDDDIMVDTSSLGNPQGLLSSFKAKLKTFLFSQYFHPN